MAPPRRVPAAGSSARPGLLHARRECLPAQESAGSHHRLPVHMKPDAPLGFAGAAEGLRLGSLPPLKPLRPSLSVNTCPPSHRSPSDSTATSASLLATSSLPSPSSAHPASSAAEEASQGALSHSLRQQDPEDEPPTPTPLPVSFGGFGSLLESSDWARLGLASTCTSSSSSSSSTSVCGRPATAGGRLTGGRKRLDAPWYQPPSPRADEREDPWAASGREACGEEEGSPKVLVIDALGGIPHWCTPTGKRPLSHQVMREAEDESHVAGSASSTRPLDFGSCNQGDMPASEIVSCEGHSQDSGDCLSDSDGASSSASEASGAGGSSSVSSSSSSSGSLDVAAWGLTPAGAAWPFGAWLLWWPEEMKESNGSGLQGTGGSSQAKSEGISLELGKMLQLA